VSFSLIGVEKAEGMEVVNEESTDAGVLISWGKRSSGYDSCRWDRGSDSATMLEYYISTNSPKSLS
jgi:hypothetical protein